MDPATAMAVLEVVAKEWEQYEKDKEFAAWRNNVSTKLNEILDNTIEILQDLRRLRIEIELNMDRRFQAYFLSELRAAISDVGDIMSGIEPGALPDTAQKQRILNISDRLRYTLKQSLAYGFAVVPVSLCGYITLMSAMRIAGSSLAEQHATHVSLIDLVFGPSLDISRKGSYAWTLDSANNVIKQSETILTEALRPATLAMWMEGFSMHAAVTVFQSHNFEPESINASEIENKAVEDAAALFTDHVNWNNVSPPPALGIDRRTNSISGARANRDSLLRSYVETAQVLKKAKSDVIELADFIKIVKRLLKLS